MSKMINILLPLVIFLGFLALYFNRIGAGRISPKYYPVDWGAYIWISEDPKAFITYDGLYGGQMEIDGEMCNIHLTISYDWSLGFEKIDDVYFMYEDGTIYMDSRQGGVCGGKTTYREDSIICRVSRKSTYFGGKKIVFTRYVKDGVSPVDFGFKLESWDGFVPDWLVESGNRRYTAETEPSPAPTPQLTPEPIPYPIPTPVPVSTPALTPEFAYLSAGVPPGRPVRKLCLKNNPP